MAKRKFSTWISYFYLLVSVAISFSFLPPGGVVFCVRGSPQERSPLLLREFEKHQNFQHFQPIQSLCKVKGAAKHLRTGSPSRYKIYDEGFVGSYSFEK